MDLFWKSVAAAIISVILGLTLGKWEHVFSLLMSVLICSMIGIAVTCFLVPVIDLMVELGAMSSIEENTLRILLKVVGISFVGELVSLLCSDAGNSAMAKLLGVLTSSVVLWLSLPIIHQFIDLLKQILGMV